MILTATIFYSVFGITPIRSTECHSATGRWPSDFMKTNFTGICNGNTPLFLLKYIIFPGTVKNANNTNQFFKILQSISKYHLLSHTSLGTRLTIFYQLYSSRKKIQNIGGNTNDKKKKIKSRSQYTLLFFEQLHPKLISLPLFLKITVQLFFV